jgi:hypothetical protein
LIEELADLGEDLRVGMERIEVGERESRQLLGLRLPRIAGRVRAPREVSVCSRAGNDARVQLPGGGDLDHDDAEPTPWREWDVRIQRNVRGEDLCAVQALVHARAARDLPGRVHRVEMPDAGGGHGAVAGLG